MLREGEPSPTSGRPPGKRKQTQRGHVLTDQAVCHLQPQRAGGHMKMEPDQKDAACSQGCLGAQRWKGQGGDLPKSLWGRAVLRTPEH